jgi:N-acetylmuramoyl-L-alanine amidase
MVEKIFWDKGHGGADPGAVGNGLKEKELVSKIVDYADSYLLANYIGVQTKQSRTGDSSLSLAQRTNAANNWGADVLVSVHINAGGGKGFETFVYNGGVGSATISLQNMLHAEILTVAKKFGAITDRGKKRANFHMIRESKMSAVLTENLFIDNVGDATFLKKDAFLKALGEGHAIGVAKYLGLPKKAVSVTKNEVHKATNGLYKVQVGAFSVKSNADALAAELKKKGYPAIVIEK